MRTFVFVGLLFGACRAFIIPLQTLVSVQATVATIVKNINQEFISEGVILTAISNSHYIGSDIISTSIIGFSIINKIANNDNLVDKKWSKLPTYTKTQKNINNIALILMVIFTKNVENAI
jgi:hypothetical protein